MGTNFHNHLLIACRAARIAFNRASRKGESLEEILGYVDSLTGIPNRKAFEEDRPGVDPFHTFILLDVKNLKQMNDTFGHLFGDRVLCSCASIAKDAVRTIGKAYRLAGDKFALVVPQYWVKTVCIHIKKRVQEDARFDISMGIAPVHGVDGLTDEVFKSAETALYQCKHCENNIYSEFLDDTVPLEARNSIEVKTSNCKNKNVVMATGV